MKETKKESTYRLKVDTTGSHDYVLQTNTGEIKMYKWQLKEFVSIFLDQCKLRTDKKEILKWII